MKFIPGILYGISGFCLLSLETIWIREVGLRTGNTVLSASLVIAVLFMFAAAGNVIGGNLVPRIKHPLTFYGIAELLTAGTAILLFLVRNPLYDLLATDLTFELLFAVMLAGPTAFFSGAGLPFVTASVVIEENTRTTKGGVLYAANLFGAATGVVVGGIALPLNFGYTGAVTIISISLVVVGIVALYFGQKQNIIPKKQQPAEKQHLSSHVVLYGGTILVASGVLSLAMEILVLKYFMLLVQASIYAVSAVLCAFIINLGIGAAFASLLRRSGVRTWTALTMCLAGGALFLALYPLLFQHLITTTQTYTPTSPIMLLVKLVGFALLVFFPGLTCIGAVFPLAWELVKKEWGQGRAFGHFFAFNKIGSAAGVFVAPYLLLPFLGLPGSFIFIGAVYGILGIVACFIAFDTYRNRIAIIVTIIMPITIATIFKRPPVRLQDGEKLLALYTGRGPVTTVVEDHRASKHIVLDNEYMLNGTAEALRTQWQESWIPLSLHPNPKDVTFIGMASGISAEAVLDFPVEHLTAVEIVPEVVTAAKENFSKWNKRLFTDNRARIIIDDGRHVVASGKQQDLIICDLFNPVREGIGTMYSSDFFAITKNKLKPGGICCVWLAAYQMDKEIAGVIIRTFLDIYPNVLLVRADFSPIQPAIGLLGSTEKFDLSESFLQHRLASEGLKGLRKRSPFFRSTANFRTLLMGDLRWIAGDFKAYPLTTDEKPFIEFHGSRVIPPGHNLRALTLLDWMGKRFNAAQFPSCKLDNTPPSKLIAGLRAGNYLYAASVMFAPLPNSSPQKLQRRYSSAKQHVNTAQKLLPDLEIRLEDFR